VGIICLLTLTAFSYIAASPPYPRGIPYPIENKGKIRYPSGKGVTRSLQPLFLGVLVVWHLSKWRDVDKWRGKRQYVGRAMLIWNIIGRLLGKFSLSRPHINAPAPTDERKAFDTALEQLDECLMAATALSGGRMGIVHTGRQNRVLMSYAKTITHCMSLNALSTKPQTMPEGNQLLDHFSIAALARCVIDSAIMTLYLSELSLTLPQWDLRRHILFLHDLTNRKRFLTALGKAQGGGPKPPFFENYEEIKRGLQSVIDRRCRELNISPERSDELKNGQTVFIDGVRGAVREAGLDGNTFDFLHSYFSNHVHSHPVSLLRADEQKISFESPSPFQLGLCATAITAAVDYLNAVNERVEAFTGEMSRDPVGPLE